MWLSEKSPRDFTDIVFQIQVKETLSGSPDNQPRTEPGSQLCVSVRKQKLPLMLLCSNALSLGLKTLCGSKH